MRHSHCLIVHDVLRRCRLDGSSVNPAHWSGVNGSFVAHSWTDDDGGQFIVCGSAVPLPPVDVCGGLRLSVTVASLSSACVVVVDLMSLVRRGPWCG